MFLGRVDKNSITLYSFGYIYIYIYIFDCAGFVQAFLYFLISFCFYKKKIVIIVFENIIVFFKKCFF